MPKDIQVGIRVEQDVLDRADRVAELLAKNSPAGLTHSRTAVMRAALLRGLAEMEAELHAKPKKR